MISRGILKPLSDAPAPAGEVASNSGAFAGASGNAHPSLTAGTAKSFPPAVGPFADSWNRLLTATGSQFHALREMVGRSVAEILLRLFGPVEFAIGDYCATCVDVHKKNERCPRAMIGRCIDCGNKWRPLDRYGNCTKGHRSISERRLRWSRPERGDSDA